MRISKAVIWKVNYGKCIHKNLIHCTLKLFRAQYGCRNSNADTFWFLHTDVIIRFKFRDLSSLQREDHNLGYMSISLLKDCVEYSRATVQFQELFLLNLIFQFSMSIGIKIWLSAKSILFNFTMLQITISILHKPP